MMHKIYMLFATMALGLVAAPASAAENLDCIDDVIDGEENAEASAFIASFDPKTSLDKDIPDALRDAIAERIALCQTAYDWSDDALLQASFYISARILERSVVAKAPFTKANWANLDKNYATIDKDVVRRLVIPQMDQMPESEQDKSKESADEMYLGMFVMRSKIPPTDANSEIIGLWIGAKGTMEVAAERFAEQ